MRCLKMLVIGVGCWVVLCPAAITRGQEEGGGGALGEGVAAGGAGEAGSMPSNQRPYAVQHVDGTSEEGFYAAFHNYEMAPGWAKPRRWLGSSNDARGGFSFPIRSGQPKRSGQGEGQAAMSAQSMPAGTFVIAALVLAKAEDETHSRVIVGQKQHPNRMGGMDGGYGGMAGMSPSAMGGWPGGMEGGGDMMGGSMGSMGAGDGMGDMMGGGMGGGMMVGPTKVVIVPLEECRIQASSRSASEPPFTVAQLKNLAELVRVDCWIDEELATLRSVRQDADKFKASEKRLKELLSKEYELQLSKQREDIERLNEKLKALQGELSRRASAQDRVVDVQLGQLILEAQGLIGERP